MQIYVVQIRWNHWCRYIGLLNSQNYISVVPALSTVSSSAVIQAHHVRRSVIKFTKYFGKAYDVLLQRCFVRLHQRDTESSAKIAASNGSSKPAARRWRTDRLLYRPTIDARCAVLRCIACALLQLCFAAQRYYKARYNAIAALPVCLFLSLSKGLKVRCLLLTDFIKQLHAVILL